MCLSMFYPYLSYKDQKDLVKGSGIRVLSVAWDA